MRHKQNIWLAALTKPDKYPLQYFWINFIVISPVVGLAVNGLSGVLFEVVCTNLAGLFGLSKLSWQISISFICIAIVVNKSWKPFAVLWQQAPINRCRCASFSCSKRTKVGVA